MSTEHKLYWIMGGIGALLITASLIAWILSQRARSEAGRATVDNLIDRINAWWWMAGLLLVVGWLGTGAVITLFALTSFFALREFITLTPTRPGDHLPLFLAFFVLIPVQYGLIYADWYTLFSIFIPVYAFLLLPSFAAVAEDVEDFLARVAKLQWGVMICLYSISHAPALLLLELPGSASGGSDSGANLLLLIYLLLVVQLSDVMQYVFGKLLGRTRIAPKVSPSKTVEGFVGGGLAAVGIGSALWWMTPFTPLQAAGMSAVIVLMGFLGGLALSAVKRSLGAKDWGAMIEGHGGMLDRLDSVSFAAPVFFHLTRYFFT